MSWRRFAWLLVLLLGITIIWAVADLKGTYEKIASARSDDADSIDFRIASLQKRIANHRAHLEGLEKLTLWPPEADIMSWLTQQADDSDVRIIGVEHLPVEQMSGYQNIPVKIIIRGDYNPLGRFINSLEHSPNAIRIDSLRIRRKEYTPEHVIMELSMSYFQKVEESS